MYSKKLYVFDAGHGGINPVTGEYVTPGKRSPHPLESTGEVFYEGVNNMILAEKIMNEFKKHGLRVAHTRSGWLDTSLRNRCDIANTYARNHDVIFISIHSNAAGRGDWHQASGISCYTSKGETMSDGFAEMWMKEMMNQFGDTVKFRTDTYTDGDMDKEANFYVLRNTTSPAILCEIGFHSNKDEVERMMTDEWKDKVTTAFLEWAFKIEGR